MSRAVFLLGIGLSLVALGLAFTDWTLSRWPGVTEANVKRLKTGMTMEQVETILGQAGSPGTHPRRHPRDFVPCGLILGGHRSAFFYWIGANGYASVTFAESDSPNGCYRLESARFERTACPSLLQHLRAWLGW